MAGYFRARIRKDNFKLEVDVERMVEQNWWRRPLYPEYIRRKVPHNKENIISIKTLSVIVNDFVPVDVILLPELGLVRVEEGVGAVLEHGALHPQAPVLQPALGGTHHPRPGVHGQLAQPVHTEAAHVLHIRAGHQGLRLAEVGRDHPIRALITAPVLIVEEEPLWLASVDCPAIFSFNKEVKNEILSSWWNDDLIWMRKQWPSLSSLEEWRVAWW